MAAWRAVHRAQELYLLSDPLKKVLAEAHIDELRIRDSRMDAEDDLLDTLHYAFRVDLLPPVQGNYPSLPAGRVAAT